MISHSEFEKIISIQERLAHLFLQKELIEKEINTLNIDLNNFNVQYGDHIIFEHEGQEKAYIVQWNSNRNLEFIPYREKASVIKVISDEDYAKQSKGVPF